MGQFLENVQIRIRSSSSSFLVTIYRFLVGGFLGLTLALVFDQMLSFGDFAFTLVIVSTSLIFLKISAAWSGGTVLVFSLFCVLIGLLLRMYIMVAPGA